MEIEFLGAARTVTGSKHVVRTRRATVVLDCGLFQGHRREAESRNRRIGIDVREIDAVVLSHAHIDHCGALPLLVKQGYDGPIYATPATRDLCAAMLMDSAMIQKADAAHIAKRMAAGGTELEAFEPLYDERDVERTLARFVGVSYDRALAIAPDFTLTFVDAGHVLGSAISLLDVEDEGIAKRLAFTGDLGRKNVPILRDPVIPAGVSYLLMESTYGDRHHPPYDASEETLAKIIHRTAKLGGKILIPSFALERAQEILFALAGLFRAGRIPKIPVYVDSPLTVSVTEVFKLHPDCYDDETRALFDSGRSPFDFEGLHYTSGVPESKAIDASTGPAIVLSASGMCEAGRILHHLRAAVEDDRNAIVLVGFQAEHTLGRRLAEHRESVRIFGVERPLRAKVEMLEGFSAHADQRELVEFATAVRAAGPLARIMLVHGEPKAQETLREKLREEAFSNVDIPEPNERIVL